MPILLHNFDDLKTTPSVKEILTLLSKPVPTLVNGDHSSLSTVASEQLKKALIAAKECYTSTSNEILDDRLLGVLDIVLTSAAAMAEFCAVHDNLGPRHMTPLWLLLLGALGRRCHTDATVRYDNFMSIASSRCFDSLYCIQI